MNFRRRFKRQRVSIQYFASAWPCGVPFAAAIMRILIDPQERRALNSTDPRYCRASRRHVSILLRTESNLTGSIFGHFTNWLR